MAEPRPVGSQSPASPAPPTIPARTRPERTPGITELAGIAAGRADLLAEVAGIEVDSHHGDMNEAMYLRAAQLCIDAAADTTQIPHWAAEGQRRATTALETAAPSDPALTSARHIPARSGDA
jgi:hypothetical protein